MKVTIEELDHKDKKLPKVFYRGVYLISSGDDIQTTIRYATKEDLLALSGDINLIAILKFEE